jgi:CheY-like chemotaxis protein
MSDSKNSRPRVLVVDYEESARKVFKEYLNLQGFQVEIAEAGEEALAKIYNYHPQIVLLDVMMPRLTGDELVKMITDWKPQIQVIMVSANASPDLKEECLRNGAFACIPKPVEFNLLSETITQALS